MITDPLENLARAWLKLVRNQTRLFFLEAKLARNSIAPFLGLMVLLVILLSCLCLCTLAVMGYGLFYFTHNLLLSVLLVELICLLGFLGTLWLFFIFYKQLQFTKTRHYLKVQSQKIALQSQDESHE